MHDFLSKEQQESKDQHHKAAPIRLKGVALPTFSGEEKSDYESWKAAFMSVVDRLDVPVEEKMLRLQSCLSGKALAMVKDLGYSNNAYERAKSKLEKRYGGERRLQIKHLTALRNFRQVQAQNLDCYPGPWANTWTESMFDCERETSGGICASLQILVERSLV